MIKEIHTNSTVLYYELQYKKVKNINLRIKADGTIHVSANKRVPQKVIEEFMLSKSDFILKALEQYKRSAEKPQTQYFNENEIRAVIFKLCESVYPYFKSQGIKYPEIRFRRMVSRWGSCHPSKGVLTFSTALIFAPIECIEYVVAHEFTHFLQPNHSSRFYEELAKIMPDWRVHRQKLKEISIK